MTPDTRPDGSASAAPLRVLFVSRSYPPDIGGIQTQNFELYTALSSIADVRLVSNGRGKLMLPIFFPYVALLAAFTASRYDVILLGDGVLAVVGWFIKSFRPRAKVVCIVHGLDTTYPLPIYRRWWVGHFMPRLSGLIAVSSQTKASAVERGIPSSLVSVVPNGVRLADGPGPDDAAEGAEMLGPKAAGKKIVMARCRLVLRKGVSWFAENVVPLLPDDVHFMAVGDGPDREHLEAVVRDGGLQDRVTILGFTPYETRGVIYRACDVFIQPNIPVAGEMEGFGIVVLEAGSEGVAVVASRLEGLQDAVEDGVNGILVTAGDATAYAETIRRLLADDEARHELGESARSWVRERYLWPTIARRYLDVLEERAREH